MAREYVESVDYSDSDGVFAFEAIGGSIYFKIGRLSDADQFFIESVIAGGFIGFFQNGEEIGFAEITADYDSTNGIQIASRPDNLSLNQGYRIKFTQARRGRDGEQPPAGTGALARVETLPPAEDADENTIYAEVDANNAILNDVLKVQSFRKTAFFAVTVGDLGDGHRGYADPGYDALAGRYDVDPGGEINYSRLGAMSQHYSDAPTPIFLRVGSYVLPLVDDGAGIAAHDDEIYFTHHHFSGMTSNGTRIRAFNPGNGNQTYQSLTASDLDHPEEALAILDGFAYVFDYEDNIFYKFDIDARTVATLSATYTGRIHAMTTHGGAIYAIVEDADYALAMIHPTTGAVTEIATIPNPPSGHEMLSIASLRDLLYLLTRQTASPSTVFLHQIDASTATLRSIGSINRTGKFSSMTALGDRLYALNNSNNAIYRTGTDRQGNRWEVVFPLSTTQIEDADDILKLYPVRGGAEVVLDRDRSISDAIVFVSDFDGSTGHTINRDDNLRSALYRSDNAQLFKGEYEAFYRELPLDTQIPIGV